MGFGIRGGLGGQGVYAGCAGYATEVLGSVEVE